MLSALFSIIEGAITLALQAFWLLARILIIIALIYVVLETVVLQAVPFIKAEEAHAQEIKLKPLHVDLIVLKGPYSLSKQEAIVAVRAAGSRFTQTGYELRIRRVVERKDPIRAKVKTRMQFPLYVGYRYTNFINDRGLRNKGRLPVIFTGPLIDGDGRRYGAGLTSYNCQHYPRLGKVVVFGNMVNDLGMPRFIGVVCTAVHEFSHWVGMDHVDDTPNIMNQGALKWCNEQQRVIDYDPRSFEQVLECK